MIKKILFDVIEFSWTYNYASHLLFTFQYNWNMKMGILSFKSTIKGLQWWWSGETV